MILITLNGETLLVDSLDGYPNAKVLGRDVPHPPSNHCRWKGGKWCEDATAKTEADRVAALAAMSRAELVDMIEALVAEQAARVDSLTMQVDAVAAVVMPPPAEIM